jgi:hypothetical protein
VAATEAGVAPAWLEILLGLVGLLAGLAVLRWRERLAATTVGDRERWRRRLRLRSYSRIERENRVYQEAFFAVLVGGSWVLISLVVLAAGIWSLLR